MTARDDTTLDFYAAEAQPYASRSRAADEERLNAFLARLPSGARILELGCGGGQDSEWMLARGFDVTPTDGSPELARQAEKRLGRPVRVLLFENLCEDAAYDGVWANACLLHIPRADLPPILARIHFALRPGGVFYASFKAGSEGGRVALGRFFNYPSAAWLRDAYGLSQWRSLEIVADMGSGYDQLPTEWLHATAIKG